MNDKFESSKEMTLADLSIRERGALLLKFRHHCSLLPAAFIGVNPGWLASDDGEIIQALICISELSHQAVSANDDDNDYDSGWPSRIHS